MKPFLRYNILICLGLVGATMPARAKSDLATPDQRRDVVNQAAALMQPEPPVPLPADLKNPFAPAAAQQAKDANQGKKATITGDREILAAIASHIIPSGVMQAQDGQLILLLREKKLKVGDYLTITFEGTDYMVELASIDHSSFTLRLNKEAITQPLNP